MFGKIKTFVLAVAAAAVGFMATAAHAAAGDNPIVTILDSVDLAGISVAIIAFGLILVGIALAFKGPDVAKRVIRKV